MWWDDIVKIESFLHNLYKVYEFQTLKTINDKKVYNDPYWSVAQ